MNSFMNQDAMESMFDPELTATKLLEAVRENVSNSVKTIDAASSLENKLSEEAARFNECLTNMSNAIHKCERGEISREEMLAECAPCVSALKEKCTAINLGGIHTTGDDITEEEIAMLREYIVGCKDIVAARKKELQDCQCAASEGLMSALADYEPATEANMAKEIRQSSEAKTANELYKQAKKLYSLGSKEQAMTYLKKAQGLYEKCLKKAEEFGKVYTVERTKKVSSTNGRNYHGGDTRSKGFSTEDKYKKKVTDNSKAEYLIEYFEDRIDSCKALEMQWNNKAGKSTYAETKAQLKEERKQAKADAKAARKEAFNAKKESIKNSFNSKKDAIKSKFSKKDVDAMESVSLIDFDNEFDTATESFVLAVESMLDSIELEASLDYVMEADDGGESSGGLGSKLRALVAKFKRAKKEGNTAEANAAANEIKDTTDQIVQDAENAETEEEVKKSNKAVQIALGTAAAIAAITTGVVIAKKNGINSADDVKAAVTLMREKRTKLSDADRRNAMQQANGNKREAKKYLDALSFARKNASKATNVSGAKKAKEGIMSAINSMKNNIDNKKNIRESNQDEQRYQATLAKMAGVDPRKGVRDAKALQKYREKVKMRPDLGSFLGALCDEYALEAFIEGEDIDDMDEIDNMEGKAFYDEDDIIENAEESELDDLATEAAIAVMMAEDGIDDSDLM